jgi:hypothetical protein
MGGCANAQSKGDLSARSSQRCDARFAAAASCAERLSLAWCKIVGKIPLGVAGLPMSIINCFIVFSSDKRADAMVRTFLGSDLPERFVWLSAEVWESIDRCWVHCWSPCSWLASS